MTIHKQRAARDLLLQESFGVLSTMSIDVAGYPFGSVTPYCVDQDCQPIVYISTIAQHTKNILANPKVSLTIVESNGDTDDVQARGRLTVLADAKPVDRGDTGPRDRYLRHFPSAVPYDQTHDFMFFRLETVRARFIGGFGQIFWLSREELTLRNPFSAQDEANIIQKFSQSSNGDLDFQIAGIDSEGFDVLQHGRKRRFPFDRPIHTIDDARQMLAMTVTASRR